MDRKVRLAARAALDRKAVDLVVLDVQGLSSVTDFFVVCSGRSTTHVASIVEAVRAELKAADTRPLHAEGTPESGWMLLDYGDVLVRLWGDAPSVPLPR
jgi:ribosome-associated protein